MLRYFNLAHYVYVFQFYMALHFQSAEVICGMSRIGIVGAGKMAIALAKGLVNTRTIEPAQVSNSVIGGGSCV